jgi:nucleotide-binding universal stress UspA family protein
MRNPMRTEAEAFTFVIAVIVLFAAVAVAGIVGGGWVGFVTFLVLAPIVFYRYVRSDPKVREPAVWDRQRSGPGARKRILVVANETVAGRGLRGEILQRAADADVDFLVVCPALNSPLRHWTSDEDQAREHAQERLEASLAELSAEGIEASGEVGDADPLQAMEDALRTFGADEIIISTHPPGRSNWLEKDVIAHARERFDLPITHVVVDLERERAAAPQEN